MTNLLKAILTVLSFIALPTLASAEDILSITNGDVTVELTKTDVAKLEQTAFETTTIWTEGKIEFSGPTLKSILELANITKGVISLTAINDYTIEIPVADITEEAPIVANLMNGEPFNRREKRPYWVIFPFDSEKISARRSLCAQHLATLFNPEKPRRITLK